MTKASSKKKTGHKKKATARPTHHKSFRITRGKIAKPRKPKGKLPGAFSLLRNSASRLRANWKTFGGILLIHLALQMVFAFNGTSGAALSEGQLLYSTFFLLIISLSYIWVLRGQEQDEDIRLSHAFYRGSFQIVPFLLIVLLAVVQAIPFLFGTFLFQLAVQGNIAVYYWERLLFAGIWLGLSIPTIYWLTTTLVSLIVVAIPGVRPIEAWKATKKLVRPYTAQILWRLAFFVVTTTIGVGALFYVLISTGQITPALLLPTLVNVLLVPLFWAYVFSVYSHLRKL